MKSLGRSYSEMELGFAIQEFKTPFSCLQSPTPNAYTLAISGRKPFIVLHTALLELLTTAEVQVGVAEISGADVLPILPLPLHELRSQADFVVYACPAHLMTRGMLARKKLSSPVPSAGQSAGQVGTMSFMIIICPIRFHITCNPTSEQRGEAFGDETSERRQVFRPSIG